MSTRTTRAAQRATTQTPIRRSKRVTSSSSSHITPSTITIHEDDSLTHQSNQSSSHVFDIVDEVDTPEETVVRRTPMKQLDSNSLSSTHAKNQKQSAKPKASQAKPKATQPKPTSTRRAVAAKPAVREKENLSANDRNETSESPHPSSSSDDDYLAVRPAPVITKKRQASRKPQSAAAKRAKPAARRPYPELSAALLAQAEYFREIDETPLDEALDVQQFQVFDALTGVSRDQWGNISPQR